MGQYNADGSGRLPDTTTAQLEHYRDAFYELYPAASVDVTVHAPIPWSGVIDASGGGWPDVLDALVQQRAGGASWSSPSR
jgi:hypothetical protein